MIISSRLRRSLRDRRSYQKQRFQFVVMLALFLATYLLLTTLFVQPWLLNSNSMAPTFHPGMRILVAPTLLHRSNGNLKQPLRRGAIVSIRPPYAPDLLWYHTVFQPIVRFFTFQKNLTGPTAGTEWESESLFKRIIGVPGDTVYIKDSIAYVKRAEDEFFMSEFEQSYFRYDIETIDYPGKWEKALPLSPYMEPIALAENEYFLLGDNRPASNDSRYWGVVDDTRIQGRVFFVYWPLDEFGRLN